MLREIETISYSQSVTRLEAKGVEIQTELFGKLSGLFNLGENPESRIRSRVFITEYAGESYKLQILRNNNPSVGHNYVSLDFIPLSKGRSGTTLRFGDFSTLVFYIHEPSAFDERPAKAGYGATLVARREINHPKMTIFSGEVWECLGSPDKENVLQFLDVANRVILPENHGLELTIRV